MSQKHLNEIQTYWLSLKQLMEVLLNRYPMNMHVPSVFVTSGKKENELLIKLEHPIIFENMPYKHNAHKKLIIYLDGECHIKFNNSNGIHLKSYITKIAYFEPPDVTSDIIMHIDGFHYDMAEQVQSAHPVFHVQRNPNILDSKINEDTYSKFKLNNENRVMNYISNIRIATPQADIFSILPMILADHAVSTGIEHQKQFMELIELTTKKNPLEVNFDDTRNIHNCCSCTELRLGYWYDKYTNESESEINA